VNSSEGLMFHIIQPYAVTPEPAWQKDRKVQD
jgi:hypothetical protein